MQRLWLLLLFVPALAWGQLSVSLETATATPTGSERGIITRGSSNMTHVAGTTVATGNGVAGTGTLRVVIASDNTAFSVNVGSFPDNEPFNLNQVGGTAISTGTGTAGTGTPRVALAYDSVKSSTASAAAQTSIGTTAGQVLAALASRKSWMIQNTGTTVIKCILGSGTPTQTIYHWALKAGSAADDGLGGSFVNADWNGAVQCVSSAAGGTAVVTEVQ